MSVEKQNILKKNLFMLPSWWIRAREACSIDSYNAMDIAFSGGLMPALNARELTVLAIILSKIQNEILQTGNFNLNYKINIRELEKHFDIGTKKQRYEFEKFVQSLSGLQLLSNKKNIFKSLKLFKNVKWQISTSKTSKEIILFIEISQQIAELILGVVNPYNELLRIRNNETTINHLLYLNAPLSISRSLWLDLNELEQSFFVKLEKNVNWSANWLAFEGIFKIDIDDFFNDTKWTNKKDLDYLEILSLQLNILKKLGKKLSQHGYLCQEVSSCPIVLPQSLKSRKRNSSNIDLLWQISKEKVLSNLSSDYKESLALIYSKNGADSAVAILDLILKRAATALEIKLTISYFSQIDKLIVGNKREFSCFIKEYEFSGSTIIPIPWLLWEWSLRHNAAKGHELPSELQVDEFQTIFKDFGDSSIDVYDNYTKFYNLLSDNYEMVSYIQSIKNVSIASEATIRSPLFIKHVNSLKSKDIDFTKIDDTSQSIRPSSAQKAAPETVKREKLIVRSKKNEKFSGIYSTKMREQALETLKKLQKTSSKEYKKLKSEYLESLDSGNRALILEISKQMPPKVFEQNIQNRLISFMLKSPSFKDNLTKV